MVFLGKNWVSEWECVWVCLFWGDWLEERESIIEWTGLELVYMDIWIWKEFLNFLFMKLLGWENMKEYLLISNKEKLGSIKKVN